jgi:hypothetical protein
LASAGGYEKDVYGLDWHETPHPHWYLPFVPANTTLRNGAVVANARVALVCEGPHIALENVNIEGAAPASAACDAAEFSCAQALDSCLLGVPAHAHAWHALHDVSGARRHG